MGCDNMKNEKTTRTIDKMGRIVIPNDIRKAIGLNLGDEVSIEISGKGVLIVPLTQRCVLCGSKYELISYCDKLICNSCIKELKML